MQQHTQEERAVGRSARVKESHEDRHPTTPSTEASIGDSVSRAKRLCTTQKTGPCQGNPPKDMTPEERLRLINQRWEAFYHQKKDFLRHYCYGDEDLVSIGLLSVRKRLEEHPDCPESWLVHRAKLDIATARASNDRLYLSFNKDQQKGEEFVNDVLEYEAMTPLQQDPEKQFLDQAQFHKMWDALSNMERKFLLILREEFLKKSGKAGHRWWGGKYAHTQTDRPKPKKRFRQEVSHSITDYYVSFANLRYHFFMNFGTDEEIEREKAWYANFNPNGRLHHKRDGRYDRD